MVSGAVVQITIFDHRGCARAPREYKGDKSGDFNDEMCVKVAQTQLKIESPTFKELASSVYAVSRILNFSIMRKFREEWGVPS